MLRDPHLIGGLQNSSWRSHWLSPSPSRESHSLFENWSKVGKIFFINWNCKQLFLEKTYVKQNIKTASFLRKMEFLLFFCIFLWFFELFSSKFWKNSENFLPLPQQNFAIQLSKLGFFHEIMTYFVPWKNPKITKKCVVLPVEAWEVFPPEIRFSADLGFH